MFWQRPHRIVYVRTQSIAVCQGENRDCYNLALPETVVTSLEVVDSQQLAAEVKQFLETIGLPKQKLVMVLSPDLVFQTVISRGDQAVEQEQLFAFFNNLPFSPENIARKVMHTKQTAYAFAANREYFQTIRDSFVESGWEITAVVPISMFLEIHEQTPVTEAMAQEILKDSARIQLGNFLSGKPPKLLFTL